MKFINMKAIEFPARIKNDSVITVPKNFKRTFR